MVFQDRHDAGQQLAIALRDRGITADIVLAIPRGGLPLGHEVAIALDTPLDIIVARKMGAPNNPEYAIGAVSADGSVWLNETAISQLSVHDDYIERSRQTEAENAQTKAARYRGEALEPELADKSVIIVDDGVATGATARACVLQARNAGASRVVLAIPVGPPDSIRALSAMADEVVWLETPSAFRAVGQFYRDFGQVTDEEAMEYLDR